MRLMMTADAVGGVWRYAIELADGLSARGVSVTLAVLGPPPDAAQAREAEAIPGLDLVPTGLPLDWTADSPEELARAGAALAVLARRVGAQSAHLHAPALLGEAPWPVPVVTVAHSCLATWWQAVRGGTVPADFAWRIAATARGLKAADTMAAPSAAFAEALCRAYALVRPVSVVHNGRRPLPVPALPRRRCVLTAGRLWDEGKGVATLDAVAARLGAPVLAAGPVRGPNGAAIVLGHAVALGALAEPDLAARYAACSVFASPARYEPFGLAVLEAAQAGMALVLSDIPTFRELWRGAALFVPPGDPAALEAALRRALDEAPSLGALSRARARRYTARRMAEATLRLHRDLLRQAVPAEMV